MAKIWFVREGAKPTFGDPVGEKSLEWCVDNLGLSQSDWKAPFESPPLLGESTSLDPFKSPGYVIIEIENQDITSSFGKGWRTGFYKSPLSVKQARERLHKPR